MSDYYPFAPKEQERELCRSEARRCFSRVGWACCAMMLAAQLGAVLLTFGCQLLAMRGSRVMIAFIQSDWFQWVMTDAANYGLGLPLMLWVLHGGARPAALPRRRVTARQFGALVPVCFTVMYLSNLIGLGVNAGHDLSLDNIEYFIRQIPFTDEVSIGHALISEALYLGLENTIGAYRNKIRRAVEGAR